jgi:hypothetical protein
MLCAKSAVVYRYTSNVIPISYWRRSRPNNTGGEKAQGWNQEGMEHDCIMMAFEMTQEGK